MDQSGSLGGDYHTRGKTAKENCCSDRTKCGEPASTPRWTKGIQMPSLASRGMPRQGHLVRSPSGPCGTKTFLIVSQHTSSLTTGNMWLKAWNKVWARGVILWPWGCFRWMHRCRQNYINTESAPREPRTGGQEN